MKLSGMALNTKTGSISLARAELPPYGVLLFAPLSALLVNQHGALADYFFASLQTGGYSHSWVRRNLDVSTSELPGSRLHVNVVLSPFGENCTCRNRDGSCLFVEKDFYRRKHLRLQTRRRVRNKEADLHSPRCRIHDVANTGDRGHEAFIRISRRSDLCFLTEPDAVQIGFVYICENP